MTKHSQREKIHKLLSNGFKYALITKDGYIENTYRYTYETKRTPLKNNYRIVLLTDLLGGLSQ